MLCGAVAEVASHLDAPEAYPVSRLSAVARGFVIPHPRLGQKLI